MKENEGAAKAEYVSADTAQEINKPVKYVLAEGFEEKLNFYISGITQGTLKPGKKVAKALYLLVKSWQPKLIPNFDLVTIYKNVTKEQEITPEMIANLEQANKQYKLYNAILQIKMLEELQSTYPKVSESLDLQSYFISCLEQQSYFAPEAEKDIFAKYDSFSLIKEKTKLDQMLASISNKFDEHVKKYIDSYFLAESVDNWSENNLSDIDKFILNIMPMNLLVKMFISTKKPVLFSESKGGNFTNEEESILGDIIFSIETLAYDNGVHNEQGGARIINHDQPLPVHMVFVPGAVLADKKHSDYKEIVRSNEIDFDLFIKFYNRKLSAAFIEINNKAESTGKQVVVTMPAIGCGFFAGQFSREVTGLFYIALQQTLIEHSDKLKNIRGVVFDPNGEKNDDVTETIDHIKFLTKNGNFGKISSQLCSPEQYHPSFKGCALSTLVAADSKSLPGNDLWKGSRATDEGVKAAASNLMQVLTGLVNCYYDTGLNQFSPSRNLIDFGNKTWLYVYYKCYEYTISLLSGDDMKDLNTGINEHLFQPEEVVVSDNEEDIFKANEDDARSDAGSDAGSVVESVVSDEGSVVSDEGSVVSDEENVGKNLAGGGITSLGILGSNNDGILSLQSNERVVGTDAHTLNQSNRKLEEVVRKCDSILLNEQLSRLDIVRKYRVDKILKVLEKDSTEVNVAPSHSKALLEERLTGANSSRSSSR
jgi:hypothetical protein